MGNGLRRICAHRNSPSDTRQFDSEIQQRWIRLARQLLCRLRVAELFEESFEEDPEFPREVIISAAVFEYARRLQDASEADAS